MRVRTRVSVIKGNLEFEALAVGEAVALVVVPPALAPGEGFGV